VLNLYCVCKNINLWYRFNIAQQGVKMAIGSNVAQHRCLTHEPLWYLRSNTDGTYTAVSAVPDSICEEGVNFSFGVHRRFSDVYPTEEECRAAIPDGAEKVD
jgi:hypothetical protein